MAQSPFPFQNPDLAFEERAEDLLGRLSLDEKIGQLIHNSPAIERLGIPDYNWWNECLHGVGRSGVATVFPQGIGLAAMWDTRRMERLATAISDEARAKHHAAARKGDHGIYKGLTYWTPNINIFRDPRWGRGQETYGECPFLTGRTAVAFIKGLQGNDEKYLKLVATPKHYAVHSGPEEKRHAFDAIVSDRDLWETYLPAFRACLFDAGAWSVMGAYNRTNGEPCCGSELLLDDILRGRWQFPGYVVSDCWAIADFFKFHGASKDPAEAAALAVKRGCDLNCGDTYYKLAEAVKRELVSEEEIDTCLRRLVMARLRLGMFDPEERVPYAQVPYSVVDSEKHRALSLDAARASLVLLKNENKALPLSRDLETVAVIGPNADDRRALVGNYHGIPSKSVTPLEGIRKAVSPETRVLFQPGCEHVGIDNPAMGRADRYFSEAVLAAEQAEAVVLVLGLTADLEGEQGDAGNAEAAGDRVRLGLPDIQQRLLETIAATGKPTVLVLMSGSAVSVPWAQENLPAILQQFYPGQDGGTALAEALFGGLNPGGRLPVTVYQDVSQLPDFEDYSMERRTYRFLKEEPLYPFGFGLSYTAFEYSDFEAPSEVETGAGVEISILVKNTGEHSGEEVAQLYVEHLGASVRVPVWQLAGFQRVSLGAGETKSVVFKLTPRELALVADDGRHFLEPHGIRLHAGGSQPDALSRQLGAPATQQAEFKLAGEKIELEW